MTTVESQQQENTNSISTYHTPCQQKVDIYPPTLGILSIFIKFDVFLRSPFASDVYGLFKSGQVISIRTNLLSLP